MIYGLEAAELPENWTPLEAFAVIECLDEDGDVALLTRTTKGLRVWTCLGMLEAAAERQRITLNRIFVSDDEDDE